MDAPSPVSPELLLAHADWVRRLAVSLVRDTALAEDLAQETWMAMLLHPPSQDRPLRPWLAEVLRNFARMWARGQGRRSQREQAAAREEHEPSPETLVARLQAQQALSTLVLALPQPIRDTVLLRYTEGLTAAEIARRQKIPAGTVRWRLKEGLDQLRGQLDQRAGGDRQAWCAGLITTFALPPRSAPAAPPGPPLAASVSPTPVLIGVASLVLLAALVPLGLRQWRLRALDAKVSPGGIALRASNRPLGLPGRSLGTGVIEGVVLAPDGRPLPGALVAAVSEAADPARPLPSPVAVVSTGEQGRFSLADLPPGTYGLSATARDFAPGSARAVTVNAGETRTGLTLGLQAGGVILTGVIEDRGGGVIPGASVSARPRYGPRGPAPVFHALADQEGRYLLRVPRGAVDLGADARGYTRVEGRLETRGDLEQYQRDFRLNPAGRLRGVVIEETTGQPVAQAEVSASAARSGFGEDAFTTTDQAGVFELGDLEPGEYALRARKGALAGVSGRALILPTAGFIGDVRLAIQRGVSLHGSVRDPAGQVLPGASILVDEGRAWARSGADGSFHFEGLLPGLVTLQPALRGHGGRPVQVEVGLGRAPPPVDLVLQPAVAIEGRVLDASGAPIAGAEVTARTTRLSLPNVVTGERRETRSAQDGSFTIDEIAGTDEISVDALHRAHGSGGVTLPQDGRPHRVTINLVPGGSVSGTVRFADGSPARGATVLARGGGTTFSGQDGRYWLGFFKEAVSLEVMASPRQKWLLRDRPSDASRRRIELHSGEQRTDVDLIISRSERTISGVVLGPDGHPLGGAVVSAMLLMGPGDSQISAGSADNEDPVISAADGSFSLAGLDTETYRVLARFPGYPDVKLLDVAAGTQGLQLRFAPAVSFAGIVLDAQGKPVAHYSLLVSPHRDQPKPGGSPFGTSDQLELYDQVADRQIEVHDATGAFALGGLPARVYDLRVESTDGAMGSLPSVSASPGEERRDLQIPIGKGIAVTGHVVDALTGAPVAGVEVYAYSFVARRSVTTGSDGAFRLEPLPRGAAIQISVDAHTRRSPSECKIVRTPESGDAVDGGTIRLLARKVDGPPPEGVGVHVWAYPEGARVNTVQEGSAAARAGIAPGDQFTTLAGRDVSDWGPQAIAGLLEGAPATPVTVTVRSGTTGALRTVTLLRESGR